jgi:DNA polymerase
MKASERPAPDRAAPEGGGRRARPKAERPAARGPAPPEVPPDRGGAPGRRAVPVAVVAAASAADTAAAALQPSATEAQGCRACPIGLIGTRTVWGEGPVGAPLMLVGEQPGDREDEQGRPFVGPAGQLLDRALAELHWSRERLYVTNAVKHFNFEWRGKRRLHKTPAQREVLACRPWLEREIALVQPQALVALGATAARSLLQQAVAVTRERGHWLTRAGDGLPVLVTLHPSALLRLRGADRDAAFADWLADLAHAGRYVQRA